MPVPVVLLAVPAVAGGFVHAFHFALLLWPFNLALPGLRAARLLPAPSRSQQHASLSGVRQATPHEDLVANAMIALVDISY